MSNYVSDFYFMNPTVINPAQAAHQTALHNIAALINRQMEMKASTIQEASFDKDSSSHSSSQHSLPMTPQEFHHQASKKSFLSSAAKVRAVGRML
ncbi:MAG: hypothetical protein ACH346_05200 [Chthoniobacterales bacterium]